MEPQFPHSTNPFPRSNSSSHNGCLLYPFVIACVNQLAPGLVIASPPRECGKNGRPQKSRNLAVVPFSFNLLLPPSLPLSRRIPILVRSCSFRSSFGNNPEVTKSRLSKKKGSHDFLLHCNIAFPSLLKNPSTILISHVHFSRSVFSPLRSVPSLPAAIVA